MNKFRLVLPQPRWLEICFFVILSVAKGLNIP